MFVELSEIDVVLRGLLLTATGMVWIVFLVRIVGLRSFSKMTSFDFVMTVATGSLLAGAGQSTSWSGFGQTLVAVMALFFVQWVTARIRKSSDRFEELTQNSPIVLMRDGTILEAALKQTRVAKDDLIAKLREANGLSFNDVRAVVLETTGDISVLHGNTLDTQMLAGVRSGEEQL
ncbi:MAG: YetF domain-containing protein [Pacificimonas sp.]